MVYLFGSVQQSIMNYLKDPPASPGSDVFDLRAISRNIRYRDRPAVWRAGHRFVERVSWNS